MKQTTLLCLLVFVGVAGWKIGDKLSADALGMAVGVLFGMLAGIPAALLVLASNRLREMQQPPAPPTPPARQLPPVIVLTGASPQRGYQRQLTAQEWQQFDDDNDIWQ